MFLSVYCGYVFIHQPVTRFSVALEYATVQYPNSRLIALWCRLI